MLRKQWRSLLGHPGEFAREGARVFLTARNLSKISTNAPWTARSVIGKAGASMFHSTPSASRTQCCKLCAFGRSG